MTKPFTELCDGTTPFYRYGGKYYPPVNDWTPTLKILRDLIQEKINVSCNHVVVNRYLSGKDHIGFHHDKVRDFADNAPVCTISFGGERDLVIALGKDVDGDKGKKLNMPFKEKICMTNGSLFVLGKTTNKYYKHKILKTSRNCDVRISLTFRNIATKRTVDGRVIEKDYHTLCKYLNIGCI